jgi:hypothetical protein
MPKADEPTADAPRDDDEDGPLIELSADTLRGDARDSILAFFKAQAKAWPFMNESERRDFADAVDRYSYELVKQVCRIIASRERPSIVGTLKQYTEKDGVEAKLKFSSTSDVVTSLHEACGQEVLVVTSGFDLFKGEAKPPEIEPDQPELGIGEEYIPEK